MVKRYRSVELLKTAVRADCLLKWRKITGGVAWKEAHAAHLQVPSIHPSAREAKEIAAELASGLRRALAFYAEPVDPNCGYWGRGLITFVQLHLAHFLATGPEFARLGDGRPNADLSRLSTLDHLARSEAKRNISHLPLVIAFLTDHLGRWKKFDLKGAADNRTMAIFSLLIGHFPTRAAATRIKDSPRGASVAEVIADQTKAIRTAKGRFSEYLAASALCRVLEWYVFHCCAQ